MSASLNAGFGFTDSTFQKSTFHKYSENKPFNKYLQAVDKHTTTVYHWQLIQQLQKAETSKHENYFYLIRLSKLIKEKQVLRKHEFLSRLDTQLFDCTSVFSSVKCYSTTESSPH